MCGDAQVSSVKANYKHIKIMNLKEKCILGAVSSYEAPSVKTLEVLSEGVLCGSGDFSIKDWENDGESLDF